MGIEIHKSKTMRYYHLAHREKERLETMLLEMIRSRIKSIFNQNQLNNNLNTADSMFIALLLFIAEGIIQ